MLRPIMAQIVAFAPAEHDAIGAEQSGRADFLVLGPSCRSIGGDVARLPRPDDRHHDCGGDGHKPARRCDDAALDENRRCIGVEGIPPPEQRGWVVDRPAGQLEPWIAELRLKAETPCGPLRRRPSHHQNDGEDDGDLTPKDSASAHTGSSRKKRRSRSESRQLWDRQQER